MNNLTSIIIPTTHRKEQAVAVGKRIFETCGANEVEIIYVIDKFHETEQAIENFILEGDYFFKRIQWNFSEDFRGAPSAWNDGLKMAHGDYIAFFTDDLWPEPGWLDVAKAVMATIPGGSGMVGFNDLHWKGQELATGYLLTRDFILKHMGGCLAFECYGFYCNDSEAIARALAVNKYAWAEQAVVRHDHWTYGARPQDESDQRNGAHWEHDFALFYQRKAAGFPNDFPPAITE